MVSRFLVTSSLEGTWPANDVPILFLGEWCRLYDRKAVWEKCDAIVAPYHWDDRERLHKDYLYLQTLYEELLSELAIKLNALHGVNHSVRYWRIIVGPWLGYFIQALFDRWAMLRKIVHTNDISGVRVLQRGAESLIPSGMMGFVPLFLSDDWNEAIYGQLLAWMDVPVEKVYRRGESLVNPAIVPQAGFMRKAKSVLAQVISQLSGVLCRDNEFFIINSYMPIMQDMLLQIKLGQIPKRWRYIGVPATPVNHAMRQWQWHEPDNADDFQAVACAMIQRHIPTAYLEGYRELLNMIKKLPWPGRAQAIFTSDSFGSDDVFKVWAAEKTEIGVPLLIGQHGGNYGMALWNFNEGHQIAISDRYLTWGWSQQGQKKIVPVGNLKGFGQKVEWDKDGVALLVEAIVPRVSYHMFSIPVAGQFLDYFEDQCRFVQALPEMLRDKVVVRLHSVDYGWSLTQRWLKRFPAIRLDDGSLPITKLIMKSRLYISTYNATTYLESMSLNIPTIVFWNPRHWELRMSAIPYFERLKSVGIFHETPESAARQMSNVWNDVSGWWESAAVQSVRREFCECYAHIPEKPLEVMRKIFRDIADEHQVRV